ncbi:pentapeptide repeat-containing protein [Burkholderia sp. Bp8986]|uniref:pentapeptide repeat-containing protein n=1 Tax=Burkholderia sp. Bp8986 TaxID=2184550 RepID=UPI000F5A82ED|nr:pentapeptide repeat-containing protein [Burkholderia sp. Bp8986]RQS43916.1 pentapeptide repeat-containing protein [Burkholderia sp. Bp8986]
MPALTIINLHQLAFCAARNISLEGALEFRGEYFSVRKIGEAYRVSEPDIKYGGWLAALMSVHMTKDTSMVDDIQSALDHGERMRRHGELPGITPMLLTLLLGQTSDLREAIFSGCSLAGQNLEGKDLSGATLDRVDLSNARMRYARFVNAALVDCDLRNADVRGAIFRRAQLVRVNFERTRLESACFDDATFSEVTAFRLPEDDGTFSNAPVQQDTAFSDAGNMHRRSKGARAGIWLEMKEFGSPSGDRGKTEAGTVCHQDGPPPGGGPLSVQY